MSTVLLRNIVVGLSFFGAGVATYLAIGINLRDAVRDHDPWPLAWAVNRISVAVIVVLIGEAVFKTPELPFTWRVAIYTIALTGACVSWVFIGIDQRRRNRRRSDKGE